MKETKKKTLNKIKCPDCECETEYCFKHQKADLVLDMVKTGDKAKDFVYYLTLKAIYGED